MKKVLLLQSEWIFAQNRNTVFSIFQHYCFIWQYVIHLEYSWI